jgi:hypothetical protein
LLGRGAAASLLLLAFGLLKTASLCKRGAVAVQILRQEASASGLGFERSQTICGGPFSCCPCVRSVSWASDSAAAA